MVQLLALDLDSTLLRADLTISPRNRQALRAAEEAGVRLVLASGRSVEAMEPWAEDLGMFDRPGSMISDDGAMISATLPRAVLVRHTFDPALLDRLLRAFEVLGLPLEQFQNPEPTKLLVPGDPELLPIALEVIQGTFGPLVRAFLTEPGLLEVLPPRADKGTALAYVAESLGLGAAEVMAIGDSARDLGMLRWAGWGVAVANADPAAKRAARFATVATHEDDAVAEAVDRYVLCRKG